MAVLLAADAAETVQLGVAQDGVVAQTLSGTNYGFCREFPEYIDLIYCGVGHPTSVIVDCIVACALLYFAITYVLLLSKLRGYRKQPYTFVQVGLVYNTLQVRFMAMHGRNSIHKFSAPQITNAAVLSDCSRYQSSCLSLTLLGVWRALLACCTRCNYCVSV